MADLSDVEQGIVDLIGGIVYPTGIAQPSAVANGAGGFAPLKIFRGWPNSAALDADLAAGVSNISVFSRGVTETNTTRYPVDYQTLRQQVATVGTVVLNNTVTITGGYDPTVSQYITLVIGPRVVVTYAPVLSDTPSKIAAALAALISAAFAPATASGAVITMASSALIKSIVGTAGVQIAEVERQRIQIQITLWCPTPPIRDNIARLIVPAMALQTFIIMPDTSACRLRYNNTVVFDTAEKAQLYRRDLIYTAEYATTVTDTAFDINVIAIGSTVNNGDLGVAPVTISNRTAAVGPTQINIRTPFKPITPN
jgi:hypothetical protein